MYCNKLKVQNTYELKFWLTSYFYLFYLLFSPHSITASAFQFLEVRREFFLSLFKINRKFGVF